MKQLLLKSYGLLIWVELLMQFRDLNAIHSLVRNSTVNPEPRGVQRDFLQICHAVDLACVFFPKEVLCLQRSAVTTLLLRRFGFVAEMVIGAQMLPFKAHAWVEMDGEVVNDKPYMRDIYQVLERC